MKLHTIAASVSVIALSIGTAFGGANVSQQGASSPSASASEKSTMDVSPKPHMAGASEQKPSFDTLDKDKNGSISPLEAAAAPGISNNFNQADKNNDLKLSRDEYGSFHGSNRTATGAAGGQVAARGIGQQKPSFDTLDKDNNGSISQSEAASAPALSAHFKEADTNNDLNLSRDEYDHFGGSMGGTAGTTQKGSAYGSSENSSSNPGNPASVGRQGGTYHSPNDATPSGKRVSP